MLFYIRLSYLLNISNEKKQIAKNHANFFKFDLIEYFCIEQIVFIHY